MVPTIEEILESKARQQLETEKNIGDVVIPIGGGTGSVLGIMAGKGFKGRMAGGLIGLLAGGGLGEIAKRELLGNNRPAELLGLRREPVLDPDRPAGGRRAPQRLPVFRKHPFLEGLGNPNPLFRNGSCTT